MFKICIGSRATYDSNSNNSLSFQTVYFQKIIFVFSNNNFLSCQYCLFYFVQNLHRVKSYLRFKFKCTSLAIRTVKDCILALKLQGETFEASIIKCIIVKFCYINITNIKRSSVWMQYETFPKIITNHCDTYSDGSLVEEQSRFNSQVAVSYP